MIRHWFLLRVMSLNIHIFRFFLQEILVRDPDCWWIISTTARAAIGYRVLPLIDLRLVDRPRAKVLLLLLRRLAVYLDTFLRLLETIEAVEIKHRAILRNWHVSLVFNSVPLNDGARTLLINHVLSGHLEWATTIYDRFVNWAIPAYVLISHVDNRRVVSNGASITGKVQKWRTLFILALPICLGQWTVQLAFAWAPARFKLLLMAALVGSTASIPPTWKVLLQSVVLFK